MKIDGEWKLGIVLVVLVVIMVACVWGIVYSAIEHQKAVTCFDYHINCEEDK